MTQPEPLQYDQYYHIYNRGNSGEILFRQERNYPYFLKLYATYSHVYPSRAFSNLFSTYTKAFNKSYQRTGSLFEKPFRRKLIANDRYFTALVAYIHRNPQKHGLVPDFRAWPHSSHRAMLSGRPTRLQRESGLDWFGGPVGFEEFHLTDVDEAAIGPLIAEEFA